MNRRFLWLLIFLLAACAETPRQPQEVYTVAAPEEELPAREQIAQWLKQAEQATIPEQQELQLKAATLLLSEGETALAEELLHSIDRGALNRQQQVNYALLRADVHIRFGENNKALNWLNNRRFRDLIDTLPLETRIYASEIRASAYAREGEHLLAAKERILIHPLLPDQAIQANLDAIWNSLSRVSKAVLQAQRPANGNEDFRGWLELAHIAKDSQGDIDAQLAQLDQWLSRWSRHPAANPLPGGLSRLRDAAGSRPTRIALLLPVSGQLGPYGRAIRDGFIAAWHRTRSLGGVAPALRLYDTNNVPDINALADQAIAEGAEMIIGPLRKQQVAALAAAGDKPVPVLALNTLEKTLDTPQQFYQFGLSPADEARQIADIAYAEGRRKALVLLPEGDWGQVVADAFNERWQALGGEVIGMARFDGRKKNYSKIIQAALNLDQSDSRSKILRKVTGLRFEFLPYRRTDMDSVFLVARTNEARAVKPLLAYHYAGDIPVYATSHVYRGTPEPGKNRDINGIRFTDIPWVLEEEVPIRDQIGAAFPNARGFQRMYALGVDSYRLYPRLALLDQLDDSRVYGDTGNLRLNEQRQVVRELMLASFVDGLAVPQPIVDVYSTRETLMQSAAEGR